MTNDYDQNDQTPALSRSEASTTAGVDDQNDAEFDTTMAAGPRSGAAGVANAELGTSGPPAGDLLTSEELAMTEVTGGSGLRAESIDNHQLDGYFESSK